MSFTLVYPEAGKGEQQSSKYAYQVQKTYKLLKSYRKTAKVFGIGKTTVARIVKENHRPSEKLTTKSYKSLTKTLKKNDFYKSVGKSLDLRYKTEKGKPDFQILPRTISIDKELVQRKMYEQVTFLMERYKNTKFEKTLKGKPKTNRWYVVLHSDDLQELSELKRRKR